MKRLALVALICLGIGFGSTHAAEAKKAKKTPTSQPAPAVVARSLRGELAAVDIEAGTLTVSVAGRGQTKQVTVTTDAGTVFELDGAAVTLVDLRAGMSVIVFPDSGTATKVAAKRSTSKQKSPN